MFTGIVEATGIVTSLEPDKENLHIRIQCPFTEQLKVDQSISHNGVCLTVTDINDNSYNVTAVGETLKRTNLGLLKTGEKINLERSMLLNGRLDGHIVQGHVDQTAVCTAIDDMNGSWMFRFEYEPDDEYFTVKKGSVCVNGVSLTVVDAGNNFFTVAVIPYTYEHTNFRDLKKGSVVNIEFDILGKYVGGYLSRHR